MESCVDGTCYMERKKRLFFMHCVIRSIVFMDWSRMGSFHGLCYLKGCFHWLCYSKGCFHDMDKSLFSWFVLSRGLFIFMVYVIQRAVFMTGIQRAFSMGCVIGFASMDSVIWGCYFCCFFKYFIAICCTHIEVELSHVYMNCIKYLQPFDFVISDKRKNQTKTK